MNINCKDASRLISAGLDRKLSSAERASLRMHLAICEACRRFRGQLLFLRQALSAYASRDPGPGDKPRS